MESGDEYCYSKTFHRNSSTIAGRGHAALAGRVYRARINLDVTDREGVAMVIRRGRGH